MAGRSQMKKMKIERSSTIKCTINLSDIGALEHTDWLDNIWKLIEKVALKEIISLPEITEQCTCFSVYLPWTIAKLRIFQHFSEKNSVFSKAETLDSKAGFIRFYGVVQRRSYIARRRIIAQTTVSAPGSRRYWFRLSPGKVRVFSPRHFPPSSCS